MTGAVGFHIFWSGPFSTWHPSRIKLWGLTFATALQGMMAAKAREFRDETALRKILATQKPQDLKALGRQVRGFDSRRWDGRKSYLARQVIEAKFDQHSDLRRLLLRTAPDILVNADPGDPVWGIGIDGETARRTPAADWPGQNLLGQILTDTRTLLTRRYPEEARAVTLDQGDQI